MCLRSDTVEAFAGRTLWARCGPADSLRVTLVKVSARNSLAHELGKLCLASPLTARLMSEIYLHWQALSRHLLPEGRLEGRRLPQKLPQETQQSARHAAEQRIGADKLPLPVYGLGHEDGFRLLLAGQ